MFNDKDIKALAYEKSIDVDRVYKALEDALATAAAIRTTMEEAARSFPSGITYDIAAIDGRGPNRATVADVEDAVTGGRAIEGGLRFAMGRFVADAMISQFQNEGTTPFDVDRLAFAIHFTGSGAQ